MSLPLAISVPHAGLQVPDYLRSLCVLDQEQLRLDGDDQAREIYDLSELVAQFATTDIARAILDLNRPENDRGEDGVVKTHTIWGEAVYTGPLAETAVDRLLREHYRPYHRRLSGWPGTAKLGVDCHTMVAVGPPIARDAGQKRPMVCLGDGGGACPRPWIEGLAECFGRYFDDDVTINRPFGGGHITRSHGREMPWVQIEISRGEQMTVAEKRTATIAALHDWCGAQS